MSCEESVIFFANLAYMAHIRKITQPFHLFQQKKNNLKKVISAEVLGLSKTRNFCTTFLKLE